MGYGIREGENWATRQTRILDRGSDTREGSAPVILGDGGSADGAVHFQFAPGSFHFNIAKATNLELIRQ